MDSNFSLFFTLIILISSPLSILSTKIEKFTAVDDRTTKPVPGFRSPRLLDLAIRDYSVNFLNKENFKTGVVNNVHLPINFNGIVVDTARFRCGSLRRYGAKVKEFHLGKNVMVNPCVERVIFIRQELGLNFFTMYYNKSNLLGYELVTPILGLLAYNGGDDVQNSSSPNPFELRIIANDDPIKIDFTNLTRKLSSKGISLEGKMLHCVSFEGEGNNNNVTIVSMVAPNICYVKKQGHFGLVVEINNQSASNSGRSEEYSKRISRWKIVLGSVVGAALGAFLLGLLFVAMLTKAKKRSKLEELVRLAYEEEVLQVSMVGHVRAPIAPPTRTVPINGNHYKTPRTYY